MPAACEAPIFGYHASVSAQELSPQERCELEALLHPFEDDDWDRQMKADAAAGKFDKLHREAEAELNGAPVVAGDDGAMRH